MCRFLEDLVKRLSEELAARLAAEGPQAAQGILQAAAAVPAAGADLPLPPWMKDSRWGCNLLGHDMCTHCVA